MYVKEIGTQCHIRPRHYVEKLEQSKRPSGITNMPGKTCSSNRKYLYFHANFPLQRLSKTGGEIALLADWLQGVRCACSLEPSGMRPFVDLGFFPLKT